MTSDEPWPRIGDRVYVYSQPQPDTCPLCNHKLEEPQTLHVVTPAPTDEDHK